MYSKIIEHTTLNTFLFLNLNHIHRLSTHGLSMAPDNIVLRFELYFKRPFVERNSRVKREESNSFYGL